MKKLPALPDRTEEMYHIQDADNLVRVVIRNRYAHMGHLDGHERSGQMLDEISCEAAGARRMSVINDVMNARGKRGRESFPDGPNLTRDPALDLLAARIRERSARSSQILTWRQQLETKLAQIGASGDTRDLRNALVDTAALLVAWAEDVENR